MINKFLRRISYSKVDDYPVLAAKMDGHLFSDVQNAILKHHDTRVAVHKGYADHPIWNRFASKHFDPSIQRSVLGNTKLEQDLNKIKKTHIQERQKQGLPSSFTPEGHIDSLVERAKAHTLKTYK